MMLDPPALRAFVTEAPVRGAGAETDSLLAAGVAAAIVGTAISDKAKTAEVAILETLIRKLP
jgi:hypothetical protein